MAETFIGEIRMFAGTYAPVLWAFCNGQIIAVSQNDALFSLIGDTYGGDGINTFGLPEMRGRIPVHSGTGPGLSPIRLGQKSGMEAAYLNFSMMPKHSHAFMASSVSADSQTLQGKVLAKTVEEDKFYSPGEPESDIDLIGGSISQTGGNMGHNNMMPYSCINFIIATAGTYPSRS